MRHPNSSSNASGEGNASSVLGDSFVTDLYSRKRLLSSHHRSDDEEDENNGSVGSTGEEGGVLGMLGQFYKQTDVTKL